MTISSDRKGAFSKETGYNLQKITKPITYIRLINKTDLGSHSFKASFEKVIDLPSHQFNRLVRMDHCVILGNELFTYPSPNQLMSLPQVMS